MSSEALYTASQINIASRDLRDAAGAPERVTGDASPPDTFNLEQAINLLSSEVRLLRERGMTNEHIADLFSASEIEVSATQLEHFYKPNEDFS